MIHPTAVVDPSARLDSSVEVGPYAVIGADVEIGAGTVIGPHVVLRGPTRIGRDNRIYQFCSLGEDPQDKKYAGEPSRLEIGDGNVIREYCTFNRGTAGGGGVTRIGSRNWVMAYVHVAHDCVVGDDVTMANGTTLAGHVTVGDFVTFGAFTVVHQFCEIGMHAFSAMGTVVFKDVVPFVTVAGNTAEVHGLNAEGLRRRGFDADSVRELKRAYRVIFKQGLTVERAREELAERAAADPWVGALSDFLGRSRRGIVR
ncbi:MAG: acyl-ACP--UDP-N-acetylglucosamine O-acyltransferase [Chromatiales bacterium]|nr:acyl-ACP--UDP-N-acetylglucosamine O-acyltransferase [Chromatiales bacterium]